MTLRLKQYEKTIHVHIYTYIHIYILYIYSVCVCVLQMSTNAINLNRLSEVKMHHVTLHNNWKSPTPEKLQVIINQNNPFSVWQALL